MTTHIKKNEEIEWIIEAKRRFDDVYRQHRLRHENCWRYKYKIKETNVRTDTSASATARIALDSYCAFLFTNGLESLQISHKNDPDAQKKFIALAIKYDLLEIIHRIVHGIVNYDAFVMHIDFEKKGHKIHFREVPPNEFAFMRVNGKLTPLIYTVDSCYHPLDFDKLHKDDLKAIHSDIKIIHRDTYFTAGLIEKDTAFVSKKTAHYAHNMLNCRAFNAMGVEDELLEYKTALDSLMAFNAYPPMLVDNNTLIKAKSLKPGQMIHYTPSATTPGLPALRRAIPDTMNLATENMEYIKYLKEQLREIYMLEIVLKDDSSASTTSIAALVSDIYETVTDLINKFLKIMVHFGEFREFNSNENVDMLQVRYHSRATQGSSIMKYNNIAQTVDMLLKLSQTNENIAKSIDIPKLWTELTETLGTSDAVAFAKK